MGRVQEGEVYQMNQRKHNKIKRLVITTGALLLLAGAPIVQANPMGQYLSTITNTIEAQAAEQLPYSQYWETQADGSWKYKLSSGGYASGWIQDEVDKGWYYMDGNGVMQSGVYKSYGKYYLLSQNHDGHFGHMVKNGENYNGIIIQASTNPDDEGALSQTTINQLRSAGFNVDNVQDISGSQHVSDGQVTTPQSGGAGSTNQQTGGGNGGGSHYVTIGGRTIKVNYGGTLTLDEEAAKRGHMY